jgi:DNA-binding transcriptional regulator YiaG
MFGAIDCFDYRLPRTVAGGEGSTKMEDMNEAVVQKCYECDGTMEGRRENYRYTECGLDSVTLVDVLVFHCKCGAIVPEIPGVAKLHENIAIDLLRKRSLLSGEEVRFLRKMTGYTATKLASVMAITKETVSRWENGKTEIGKESDRLLRFVCLDAIVRNTIPDLAVDTERLLSFVKSVASLSLPEVFQQLDEQVSGSKPIKMNPAMLSRFGSNAEVESIPKEPVLQ